MVLFANAVSSITIGKLRNTKPTMKNIAGALTGNKAEAFPEPPALPKIKPCKEIMAELNKKPLTFYILNGRPILCNLGKNIKLN